MPVRGVVVGVEGHLSAVVVVEELLLLVGLGLVERVLLLLRLLLLLGVAQALVLVEVPENVFNLHTCFVYVKYAFYLLVLHFSLHFVVLRLPLVVAVRDHAVVIVEVSEN